MVGRDRITLESQIPAESAESEKSDRRRTAWLAGLALSGLSGVGCGIAGLLLSFLAAKGAVEPSSGVRFAVPVLIVLALTSFMCCAHCMDRLGQLRIEN